MIVYGAKGQSDRFHAFVHIWAQVNQTLLGTDKGGKR